MKIEVSPTCLLLGAVLLFDNSMGLLATALAMLLHELGHLLAAHMLHIKIKKLSFDVFGAKIMTSGVYSYEKEAWLAIGGPLCSLLLAVLLFPFKGTFPLTLAATSLSLGIFNLLPIEGFDGGRVLHAILTRKLSSAHAAGVLAISSYLSLFLLFLLASCVLLRFGESLSLAVLCAHLFVQIFLAKGKGPTA